ncbi:MAG: glycosyltransferase [Phycisphaerales bacterium]
MIVSGHQQPTAKAGPSQVATWRVRAIIPSFGREADVAKLLADLARQRLDGRGGIQLSVTVVDNASPKPLATIPRPWGLAVEHLRLDANAGGSGGFNAGLRLVLSRGTVGDRCEFLWLLDSDVRLADDALARLVEVLAADPTLAAVGSALVDPLDGTVFEVGGRIDPRTGEYIQPAPPEWTQTCTTPAAIDAEYVAACSLLVRRTAAEAAGLMQELFISGDDVEWCQRIARRTGLGVAVAPASRAMHPKPDRMRTGARYFAARNAFVAIGASGASRAGVRFRRALREGARAAAMTLIGRDDLAELHLRGLRNAGRLGPAPTPLEIEAPMPLEALPRAVQEAFAAGPRSGRLMLRSSALADPSPLLRECQRYCIHPIIDAAPEPSALRTILRRLVFGPPHAVAVVSARARPGDWLAGRILLSVAPDGIVTRRIGRLGRAWALATVAARALASAIRLAWRATEVEPPPPLVTAQTVDARAPLARGGAPARLSLTIVILSYNRWNALARTLAALATDPDARDAEIIVVDNGSTDGTPGRLEREFPGVRVVAIAQNRGVEGFNIGVREAQGDLVLILDDDAIPAPGVLGAAMDHLSLRPDLGAVALHPRHPATGKSEWPFAERFVPAVESVLANRWPVMGCANLVRREAWKRVNGYEADFFLYRNDMDLAMKLVGAGWGVRFDPAWVAWHDSPAAARKSARWFRMATRNWVWACRRHGSGVSGLAAMVIGWAWAHRLAGWRVDLHWRALRGLMDGLLVRPPPLPAAVDPDGSAVVSLLRLRWRGRRESV